MEWVSVLSQREKKFLLFYVNRHLSAEVSCVNAPLDVRDYGNESAPVKWIVSVRSHTYKLEEYLEKAMVLIRTPEISDEDLEGILKIGCSDIDVACYFSRKRNPCGPPPKPKELP